MSGNTLLRNACFTLTNYDDITLEHVRSVLKTDKIRYAIFGHEISTTGTPHLQGFVSFMKPQRLSALTKAIPRAHWEKAKGNEEQNRTYCSKEDNYEEFGTRSKQGKQGKRTAIQHLREGGIKHVIEETPREYVKYHRGLSDRLVSETKLSLNVRNPKGMDILYVIEDKLVDTIIVSSTRYDANKLRENKPGAQLAFCVNTNLHNAPANGTGMLCMLHFTTNRISLAIICNGDLFGANYLIWNGNGSVSSITNAYHHDIVTLGKSWQVQYVSNQDVKGCYVNQVFGNQIKFIDSQPSLIYPDDHFQSNVDGPDVIMLPPSRMLNLLQNGGHHERYMVLYCPYIPQVKTASNLDKFAVTIHDAVQICGDFKVGTFVDISLFSLCSIENNMSLTEFTKFVISNKIGSEYRRLIPPKHSNLRIKVMPPEQFQEMKGKYEYIKVDEHEFLIGFELNEALNDPDNNAGVLFKYHLLVWMIIFQELRSISLLKQLTNYITYMVMVQLESVVIT